MRFIVRSNNQDFYLTKSFPNLLRVTSRCLLLITVFAISMTVGALYTEGDQYNYGRVYDAIGSLTLAEAFVFYTQSLSSIEIVHFLFIWLLSGLISKVLLFSFANVFLAFLVIRYFDFLKVNFFVSAFFVLTNFYVYVLFFAAERLKFGFIILLLGLLISYSKRLRNTICIASIFGHFQMLIVLAPRIFELAVLSLVRLFHFQKFNFQVLYLVLVGCIGFFFLDAFAAKFEAYNRETLLIDFLRISLFLTLALWYSIKRRLMLNVILQFTPLLVAVYLLGGDRVNMIAYIYFLAYGLTYRNGLNMGVFLTSIYFFGKTIFFLNSINEFGHGFG